MEHRVLESSRELQSLVQLPAQSGESDQAAQGFMQLGLENIQRQRSSILCGQHVPLPEKCFSLYLYLFLNNAFPAH